MTTTPTKIKSVTFDLGYPAEEDLEVIDFEEGNYAQLLCKLLAASANRFFPAVVDPISIVLRSSIDYDATGRRTIITPLDLQLALKAHTRDGPIRLVVKPVSEKGGEESLVKTTKKGQDILVVFKYVSGVSESVAIRYDGFLSFKRKLREAHTKTRMYNPHKERDFFLYPVSRAPTCEDDLERIDPVLLEQHLQMCRQTHTALQVHVRSRTWKGFRDAINSPSVKASMEAVKDYQEQRAKAEKLFEKTSHRRHTPPKPRRIEGANLVNIIIRVDGEHLAGCTLPRELLGQFGMCRLLLQRAQDCLLATPKDRIKIYSPQLDKVIVRHEDFLEAFSKSSSPDKGGNGNYDDDKNVVIFDCSIDDTPLESRKITLTTDRGHSKMWDWPLGEDTPCVTFRSLEEYAMSCHYHFSASSSSVEYGALIRHVSSGRKVTDQETLDFILKREAERFTEDIRFAVYYYRIGE